MHLADTLSRAYLTTLPTAMEREISEDIEVTVHTLIHTLTISNRMLAVFREATQQDPILARLRHMLTTGGLRSKFAGPSELQAYAKAASDIHEADDILFLNNNVIVDLS